MTVPNLSRLKRVDLRECWRDESRDFTPWLAQPDNIALLGEALGIELQLESQEKEVGPYRADIVCRDTSDSSWVLIENQLEGTDHSHLGQILTYAAGLGAVTVVWIARRFTDEHRATLDWLNEISGEDFRFFGLEIEAWRIGDSAIAPKFNIVAKPNDWTKGGRPPTGELTPAKQLQMDFWRGFHEYALAHAKLVKPTKALPQNWMSIALGRSGFKLAAIASHWDSEGAGYSKQELRAQLEVFDRTNAKDFFALLLAQKEAIEREFGEPLTWYNPENARACRAYIRRSGDLQDLAARPEQYKWLVEKLDRLHQVFAGRVRNLELPETEQPA
jgi:hypothetical protein